MEPFDILEKFGVPITMCIAFGYFIWKQNKFIQDELQKELRESFNRLEGILVKLIDQQKKMQLEQMNLEQLQTEEKNLLSTHQRFLASALKLDLTRGKPSAEQLTHSLRSLSLL